MASPIADLTQEINALIAAVNKLAAAENALTGGMNNTRVNGSTKTEWVGDQARNNNSGGHTQQQGWTAGLLGAAAIGVNVANKNSIYVPHFMYTGFGLKNVNRALELIDKNENLNPMGVRWQFVQGQLRSLSSGSGELKIKSPFEKTFKEFERRRLLFASHGKRGANLLKWSEPQNVLEKGYDLTAYLGHQSAFKLGQGYETARSFVGNIYENYQNTNTKRWIDMHARLMTRPMGSWMGNRTWASRGIINAGRFMASEYGKVGLAAGGYEALQAFKGSWEQAYGKPSEDPNAPVYRPLNPWAGGAISTAGAIYGYAAAQSLLAAGKAIGTTAGIGAGIKSLASKSLVTAAVAGAIYGMYKTFSGEYKKEFEETKETLREIGFYREHGYDPSKQFGYMRLGMKGTKYDIQKEVMKMAQTEARKAGYGITGMGGYWREVGNIVTFDWVKDRNTLIREAAEDLAGRIKRAADNQKQAMEYAWTRNFRKYSSKLAQATNELKDLANPAWKEPKKLYLNMQAARLASRNYGSGLFTRGRERIGD